MGVEDTGSAPWIRQWYYRTLAVTIEWSVLTPFPEPCGQHMPVLKTTVNA